jgi:hypothetical protein
VQQYGPITRDAINQRPNAVPLELPIYFPPPPVASAPAATTAGAAQ